MKERFVSETDGTVQIRSNGVTWIINMEHFTCNLRIVTSNQDCEHDTNLTA